MSFLSKLFGIDDAKAAAQNAARQNRAEANAAYSTADSLQRPYYNTGVTGLNTLSDYLGLNGTGAQTAAFNTYQMSPDVQFRMQQGINAIDNSSAARTGGVLSGGLLKRLQEYGTGVATQDYGNYLSRLAGVAGMGQNAANTLTGARYNTANLVTGANTNEGNAIANAELAGGNLLMGGLGLLTNLAGYTGFNPFGRAGGLQIGSRDPWAGIR